MWLSFHNQFIGFQTDTFEGLFCTINLLSYDTCRSMFVSKGGTIAAPPSSNSIPPNEFICFQLIFCSLVLSSFSMRLL